MIYTGGNMITRVPSTWYELKNNFEEFNNLSFEQLDLIIELIERAKNSRKNELIKTIIDKIDNISEQVSDFSCTIDETKEDIKQIINENN